MELKSKIEFSQGSREFFDKCLFTFVCLFMFNLTMKGSASLTQRPKPMGVGEKKVKMSQLVYLVPST